MQKQSMTFSADEAARMRQAMCDPNDLYMVPLAIHLDEEDWDRLMALLLKHT